MIRATVFGAAALALAFLSAPATGNEAGGGEYHVFEPPAGVEVVTLGTRRYVAQMPANPKGAPVIVALHGAAKTPEMFGTGTGLGDAAVAAGYAVLFPIGTSRSPKGTKNWNAGHCCAFAFVSGSDDTGFIDSVLADAAQRYGVDTKRLYVAGFSAGGMLGLRYALTHPGGVMAVASVSGTPDPALMPPKSPVPLLMIYGTDDDIMPFAGGFVADEDVGPGGGYQVDGPLKVVSEWRAAMGLMGEGISREIDTTWDFTSVAETDWADAAGKVQLRFMLIDGGTHSWPGGAENPDAEVSGKDEVLRFFAEHGGPSKPMK